MMSPLEILCQLIATPSVNPMGRELTGDTYGERRMSDWLMAFFQSIGAPCERLQVLPGRDNVLARYQGCESAGTILLDAHQDTVPVEGMSVDPFKATIRDGRIYGRGAADVKGSMAAMLSAFARLFREQPTGVPSVVMSCTCDEEATAAGVRQLVTYWQTGGTRSELLAEPPRQAIVAEPTSLDVVVAHRGVVRCRIHTTGQACHSSHPEQGRNAIYRMAHVLQRLEQQATELIADPRVHPLCGGRRLSVGRIDGGMAVNIVPDACHIELDRRLIPGEEPEQVWQDLQASLQELGDDVFCEPAWLSSPPLHDGPNHELAQQLLQTVGTVVGPRRQIGVPYCTNASTLGAAGIPVVVFGPGSIDQAHTRDEFIAVDQLEAAAEIYFRFCTAQPAT